MRRIQEELLHLLGDRAGDSHYAFPISKSDYNPTPGGVQGHSSASECDGGYNRCFHVTDHRHGPQRSHFRWTVCALLFFATTINYVDRQVLSMLAKTLEEHIGWTAIEYGSITTAFSAGLRDRVAGRGPVAGQVRHAHRFCDRGGGCGAWRRCCTRGPPRRSRSADRARAAGVRRSGQFPGLHQDGGGVVSQAAARHGYRHFQFRLQHRARWPRFCWCPGWRRNGAGNRRSWSPAPSASSGWQRGCCSTGNPRSTPRYRRRSSR